MSNESALVVVEPIEIDDTILISSTVAETDYAAWSNATTYAAGDRVILVSTHKIYESLLSSNLNKDPTTETTYWLEVGATNRWKCFDTSNSTQTVKSTSATYVLNFSQAITHIALLNLTDVISMRVRLNDPTFGAVYDTLIYTSQALLTSTWHSFFFGARTTTTVALFTDIPNYPNATVTVDISGQTTMAFGVLLFGVATTIGQSVNLGATISIRDFSRKEQNEFGDTVLVKRAYAKKASFSLRLLSADVDSVAEFLSQVRSTPCLWIGSSLYNSTIIFGIYEDFDVTIVYSTESTCSLNLLGLT